MKIVKNTKFFLVGMVSGMLVLKSIEMMMEKNNMSCKKAMNNFETKMKKKMNQLNEKVQDFDFDEWKQKAEVLWAEIGKLSDTFDPEILKELNIK